MAQTTVGKSGGRNANPVKPTQQIAATPVAMVLRIVLLGIVDVFAIQMAITFSQRISLPLGIGIGLFTILVNIVFFDDRLFPWRWITPAAGGMALLVVYPMLYSLVIAFTNYSTGHLEGKEVVIKQYEGTYYTPVDATVYKAYIYARNEDPKPEDFQFFLIDPNGKQFVASAVESGLKETTSVSLGALNDKGIPTSIGEFQLILPQKYSQRLQNLQIDIPPHKINFNRIVLLQQRFDATEQIQKYTYNSADDTLKDNETGEVYRNNQGQFVYGEGDSKKELSPGFATFIGLGNVLRVIQDPDIRDPFFRVFVWTIVFAIGSVTTTFGAGLMLAIVLNSHNLPFRSMWRSILILPYAIPFWLSAVTWRGLLNPEYGQMNLFIKSVFGVSPNWFADPTLAKIAVLLVNLYLGFPYMMLICLGALQSIPSDMYEAATIDGADDVQQFRFITLPLLLVAVGPLLVASFAYNFNNFTLIELLNNGGPPISAATVAGHTDILLSYTYRLAFAGTRGNDYAFAAAIGIFIFIIVGSITFFNFRFTNQLEKVSE